MIQAPIRLALIAMSVGIACPALAGEPETPISFDARSDAALLIYAPNPGDTVFRKLDMAARRATETEEVLVASDDADVQFLKFDSEPLQQVEAFDALQTEQRWTLNEDSEFVFAYKLVPPGDYALVHYEGAEATNERAESTPMCWIEKGAATFGFRSGHVYYMDAVDTMLEQADPERPGDEISLLVAARLVGKLLQQNPNIQGKVQTVFNGDGGIVLLSPASGAPDADCEIELAFDDSWDQLQ